MGTILQDAAFTQKLVRIISSAAICGMSFSFIIGEAVDQKAKDIQSWAAEPRFIPLSYLPLQPLAKSLEGISFSQIGASVLAANTQTGKAAAAPVVASSSYKDTLRMVLAAPALPPMSKEAMEPPPPRAEVSLPAKGGAPVAEAWPQEEIRSSDIEAVMFSIHQATSQLSGRVRTPSLARGAAISSKSAGKKTSAPEAVIPKGGDEIILADNSPAPPPPSMGMLATTGTTLGKASEGWIIRGRVIADSESSKSGHYEVGLFAKVDQDAVPVGYPIAQQILPAGKMDFELKIPAGIERGFLYGEFVQKGSGKRIWIAPPVNPWQKGDRQMAELRMDPQDKISSVSAAATAPVESDTKWIKGSVTTYFEPARAPIAQEDVVVKVRGRKESARTTKSGEFQLAVPRWKGPLQLEFLKAGYQPAVVTVRPNQSSPVKIQLASRDAVEQIASRLGIRQISTKGVFLGKFVDADGRAIKGATVQMGVHADGPFYFREDGQPAAERKSTSADGRFLFFNVDAGTGFVESSVGGESVAPFLVSTVEGGELVSKTLEVQSGTLAGRLFNPVGEKGRLIPIGGARLRIEGDTDFITTDALGAFSFGPARWIKGERISLDLSVEKYNNHRYLLEPKLKDGALNLFAFPATYMGRLARSMDIDLDSNSGIVLGRVSGMRVRIDALAEHATVNPAKDFYFDAQGKLRGSHSATDPKFGTYVVFNVPRGSVLIHGQDGNGVLRYSGSVVSSPAAISVLMD
jgi:hypothetical protein